MSAIPHVGSRAPRRRQVVNDRPAKHRRNRRATRQAAAQAAAAAAARCERLEPRRLLAAPAVDFITGAGYAAAGFTPTDVAVGKFNNDAYPDLVVGGNNQARILAGDGRGGFTLA